MYEQAIRTRNPNKFIKFLEDQKMNLDRYQYLGQDAESYIVKDIFTGIKGSLRR